MSESNVTDGEELSIGLEGEVLAGDRNSFIRCLEGGAHLIFRARWDPSVHVWPDGGKPALGLSVESFKCRNFVVVPEFDYFAGIIGPLYCAANVDESYLPMCHDARPIYFYQALDCFGQSSVRHFHTHPHSPQRPDATARYNPLTWQAISDYRQVIHVDEEGVHLQNETDQIQHAIEEGKNIHVMVKNLYDPLMPGNRHTFDYWIGLEVDLSTFFIDHNMAAASIFNSIIFIPQLPISLNGSAACSLLMTTKGELNYILRTHQLSFISMENGVQVPVEQNIHQGFASNVYREIRWFIEKESVVK